MVDMAGRGAGAGRRRGTGEKGACVTVLSGRRCVFFLRFFCGKVSNKRSSEVYARPHLSL